MSTSFHPATAAALGSVRGMYPAPRNRLLAWVAQVGSDLPELVQERLRANFFTSTTPLVVGAINTITVAAIAYFRSSNLAFAAIAVVDLLLLLLRLRLLQRVNAPSGPVFATGLLWASLQSATIALVVASADMTMSMVVLASGLAAIGGIIGRNFAAPRYAMMQVLVIDFGFKASFSIVHPVFLPLILVQSVIFILMNWGVLQQHRKAAIQALLAEVESRRQAITDPLTGLLNRRGLEQAFDASRSRGRRRALFYLDLDGFKQVNDRLGHAAGDSLLCEVGRRLRETAGPKATACRLGGDEFLLLVEALDPTSVDQLVGRLIDGIGMPYQIEDGVMAVVGVSIGVAEVEPGAVDLSAIMLQADRALYTAKAMGKGRCIVHGSLDTALGCAA